jgi:hypothetical protein
VRHRLSHATSQRFVIEFKGVFPIFFSDYQYEDGGVNLKAQFGMTSLCGR